MCLLSLVSVTILQVLIPKFILSEFKIVLFNRCGLLINEKSNKNGKPHKILNAWGRRVQVEI